MTVWFMMMIDNRRYFYRTARLAQNRSEQMRTLAEGPASCVIHAAF